MADLGTLLGESGVILTGIGILWKFVLVRPLEKAEQRETDIQEKADKREAALLKRIDELTEVIKDAAEEKRHRLSLPPPRNELPTLDAIKVLGYDPEEEERRRQRPLNTPEPKRLPLEGLGGRTDSIEHEIRRYNEDMASTPPEPYRKRQPSRKG